MSQTIAIGTTIPGIGKITQVDTMVGLLDRLRGKVQRENPLFLVRCETGARYKVVLARDGSSRIHLAAERLRRFPEGCCVPRVYYVDDTKLVLEYVEGDIVTAESLTLSSTTDLATFIVENQVELTDVEGEPAVRSPEQSLTLLSETGLLPAEDIRRLLQIVKSEHGEHTRPAALCFSDSALKNFVRCGERTFRYIDAFGVLPKLLGTTMVRQTLSVPPEFRRAFLDAYLDASPFRDDLSGRIPEYFVTYLSDTVLSVLADGEGRSRRRSQTGYRRRRRDRKRRRAVALLREFLALDPALYRDSDGFSSWLITQQL